MTLSTSPAVAQILQQAAQPLTIAEIIQGIQPLGAARTARPEATVRSALLENSLIATLGGRPARYIWWPNHLPGCSFRQPLAQMGFNTGELPLTVEVLSALWPDFLARRASPAAVTIELSDGPTLVTTIDHLRAHEPVWGLAGEPQLAEWFRALRATPDDDLIVSVVDVTARQYRVALERKGSRAIGELRARDERLLQAAMDVVRASHAGLLLHHDLVPRLIARGAFRSPVPPGPLAPLLRSDLRFVVTAHGHVSLTARVVMQAEHEQKADFGSYPEERPQGDWLIAQDETERRAWGEYLFNQGMEFRWAGRDHLAEAYYRAALMTDAGHADAWVHVGNIRLDEGLPAEALQNYLTAEAAALARTIGDPATYPGPFWLDLDSRPYMRALHGKGLALWRLARTAEAVAVFRQQVALNPNDNQGVRFLLRELEAGLTWEASAARFEEGARSQPNHAADE
jgi:tetratricopeptide (TPR) repeat protein